MWATALRELKYHPARYIATLLAVAISVGFMAASSILTATESHAMAMQKAAPYTAADLVFTPPSRPADPSAVSATVSDVTDTIAHVPGVAAVEPLVQVSTVITHDAKTEFSTMTALPSPDFRTVTLKEGAFPETGQILLNSALMKNLGVSIGGTVKIDGEQLTVSGVSNDPTSLMLGNPAYLNPQWTEATYGEPYPYSTNWLVRLAPGADSDAASVLAAIDSATAQLGLPGSTTTGAEFVAGAAASFTGDVDTFKYLLWVFAGVALVVGLITIANTFTILLTGRQRQIGLIRAIGATGRQVRHSIWAEGVILGLIGSLLGIGLACGLSALLGLFTGSIHFGLIVPLRDTVIAVTLGVIVTFIACVAPARRATRVPPIEALQPAASAVVTRQVSIVRAIVCGLFIAAGVIGSVLTLTVMTNGALLVAVVSAMCLAIGVLFGARLFVPGLLRGLAAIVKHWGPAANVAAKNVVRDPRRAAATATALMLAVGLIVTLQVGSASIERTVTDKIEAEWPIDLTLQTTTGVTDEPTAVPADLADRVAHVGGLETPVDLSCKWTALAQGAAANQYLHVCRYDASIHQVAIQFPATMPDDQLWSGTDATITGSDQSEHNLNGLSIALMGTNGPVTLTGVTQNVAQADGSAQTGEATYHTGWVFVSPTVYDALAGTSLDRAMVIARLTPGADTMSVYNAIQTAADGDSSTVALGGSLGQKYMIEQAMNILVGTMTVLLAVAVLIALVGVSNTLTLSVLERSRESAILRAVGAQKRQLRAMMLIEALLLTVTGAIIGVIAGGYFGWLGAKAMVQQFQGEGFAMNTQFAINWPQTIGLLAILVIAAALASLLPGRRAAKASPVAALAEV